MWQAIKKFRQAYLDAKGDRLHAEAEASRHALCQSAMSVEEASQAFCSSDNFDYEQARQNAIRMFPSCKEERDLW
ncbi:hypothetical protein [Vibrio sp. TBV020]|uniref:hypothetical protein n=1 Tax=Vibrio sp. TBV020 TaxID=3137398 RepID=UPI0038CD3134